MQSCLFPILAKLVLCVQVKIQLCKHHMAQTQTLNFLLSPSLVPAASWCGIAAVQFTQITWLFFFHLFHWRQALSLTLQLVSLCIARHDLRLKSLGCHVNTHLNTLDQWTDNTFVFIEVLTLADCQLMKCIWLAISGWYVCSYCLRK